MSEQARRGVRFFAPVPRLVIRDTYVRPGSGLTTALLKGWVMAAWVVYKAEDTRLHRFVALKFLPAIAVQIDRKIVVGGISGSNPWLFGVARLSSDGSLDAAFANGGKVTTQFNGTDQLTAVLIQADGKIVGVGQTLDPNTGRARVALARYLGQ